MCRGGGAKGHQSWSVRTYVQQCASRVFGERCPELVQRYADRRALNKLNRRVLIKRGGGAYVATPHI